ncbi:hypothetical protein GCK72_011991 [Caenorhabditis remanei]|uniref:Uncharacterized protein n=1 Tax=Caenorhabditis remanei TaxID=31234 RepID=A0A6A5GLP5_CAERE|nr:hypothetical protein GCK72_011991 [Caenorhabditis remanei]KAF1755541.1 hypothetical protein GCK72_011991 [Caenorhabditis remanei]
MHLSHFLLVLIAVVVVTASITKQETDIGMSENIKQPTTEADLERNQFFKCRLCCHGQKFIQDAVPIIDDQQRTHPLIEGFGCSICCR